MRTVTLVFVLLAPVVVLVAASVIYNYIRWQPWDAPEVSDPTPETSRHTGHRGQGVYDSWEWMVMYETHDPAVADLLDRLNQLDSRQLTKPCYN